MKRELQSAELCCPQRRQDFCVEGTDISGVASPIARYLQFVAMSATYSIDAALPWLRRKREKFSP